MERKGCVSDSAATGYWGLWCIALTDEHRPAALDVRIPDFMMEPLSHAGNMHQLQPTKTVPRVPRTPATHRTARPCGQFVRAGITCRAWCGVSYGG